jgi:NDP-sugar pyrophosphorylase family protein
MILAAGLGTRLRPLTDNRPKALVEVGGRTLLEITLSRLRSLGIREVIINVHHFADMVLEYLRSKQNFGMRIEISREETLLDTGGGLKRAAPFFLEGSDPAPFVLHNVDIISSIDIRRMAQFHSENRALVTLAVQDRDTARHLLFDQQLLLCGRRAGQHAELTRPSPQVQALAFSGIHVISPRIFSMMSDESVFSIIACYLHLAAQGEKILAFRADEYDWRDLGRPESILQAAEEMQAKHGAGI